MLLNFTWTPYAVNRMFCGQSNSCKGGIGLVLNSKSKVPQAWRRRPVLDEELKCGRHHLHMILVYLAS